MWVFQKGLQDSPKIKIEKFEDVPLNDSHNITKFSKDWKIMEVKLIIGEDEQQLTVEEGKTIKNLLQMKEIPVETVVVKKNQAIIMEEELLEDGDVIEVIKVIYGG